MKCSSEGFLAKCRELGVEQTQMWGLFIHTVITMGSTQEQDHRGILLCEREATKKERAETEDRGIRNTFCFLVLFCFILFTTFLKREYAWQLYCGIHTCGWRHLTLPAQIYKWTPAVWEILLKSI